MRLVCADVDVLFTHPFPACACAPRAGYERFFLMDAASTAHSHAAVGISGTRVPVHLIHRGALCCGELLSPMDARGTGRGGACVAPVDAFRALRFTRDRQRAESWLPRASGGAAYHFALKHPFSVASARQRGRRCCGNGKMRFGSGFRAPAGAPAGRRWRKARRAWLPRASGGAPCLLACAISWAGDGGAVACPAPSPTCATGWFGHNVHNSRYALRLRRRDGIPSRRRQFPTVLTETLSAAAIRVNGCCSSRYI